MVMASRVRSTIRTVLVGGTMAAILGLPTLALAAPRASTTGCPRKGCTTTSTSTSTTAAPADSSTTTSTTAGPTTTTTAAPTTGTTAPASGGSSTAPDTQGTWTSPEGARLEVVTTAPWTLRSVYDLLVANSSAAGDFAKIAPHLTVRVRDDVSTMTYASASTSNGVYVNFSARVDLKASSGYFYATPDAGMAHEYGHAWNEYHRYLDHQGDWSAYAAARWTTADGSNTLATDSRTDSSYSWSKGEISADDYRLLFGSATAQDQRGHLNTSIPNPRTVPGLRDAMLRSWASA